MNIEQDKKWEYNPKWSWTTNRDDWVIAVNAERLKYSDDLLPIELAHAKFEEQYPQKEYDGKT